MAEKVPTPTVVNKPLPAGLSVTGKGVAPGIESFSAFSIRPRTGLTMTKSLVKAVTALVPASSRPALVSKRYLPGCNGTVSGVKDTTLPAVCEGVSVKTVSSLSPKVRFAPASRRL